MRRTARSDLLEWSKAALAPLALTPAAHHRLLIRELSDLAKGTGGRLIVLMPPGSAKSTYASKLFAAWYLAQADGLQVIGASHISTYADTISRAVQRMIAEFWPLLGYKLRTDAVDFWETTNGGAYRSLGVGGGISGQRADLVIIDDPFRSRADADSPTKREAAWQWLVSDINPRLKPGGRIVLIQTRWHQDDLAGRLLEIEPEQWRVISLPAFATSADDALGRPIGAPLWAEDDGYGFGAELEAKREEFRRRGAMRDWEALYQQSPIAQEGSLFDVTKIVTLETMPPNGTALRGWDLAATKKVGTGDPDYTVGVKLVRIGDAFVVEDVVRTRGGPAEIEALIVATANHDGRKVRISLPQDPGQAGVMQVAHLTSKLSGYRVESSTETGDKATRAAPAASQCNVGNVAIVRASWNRAFLDELRDFPAGRKDDQVDAFSRAFNGLTSKRSGNKISSDELLRLGIRI